jgi:hypothetical protein
MSRASWCCCFSKSGLTIIDFSLLWWIMMALLIALLFFCNWLVEFLELGLAYISGVLIFIFVSVRWAVSPCAGELYSKSVGPWSNAIDSWLPEVPREWVVCRFGGSWPSCMTMSCLSCDKPPPSSCYDEFWFINCFYYSALLLIITRVAALLSSPDCPSRARVSCRCGLVERNPLPAWSWPTRCCSCSPPACTLLSLPSFGDREVFDYVRSILLCCNFPNVLDYLDLMVSRSIWFCLVNISFFVILILILLSCFRLMHWTSSEIRFSSSISLVLRYCICLSSTSALWECSFDFSNSKGVRVCKVFCYPAIVCLSPLLTIIEAVPWLAVPSPASTSSNLLKFASFWLTSKSR